MEVRSVVVKSVETTPMSTPKGFRASLRSIMAFTGGIVFLVLSVSVVLFLAKAFYDTGELKTIITHGTDACSKVNQGIGLEDIAVFSGLSREVAFMSGGDRHAWTKQVHQVGVFNRSLIASVSTQGQILMYDLMDSGDLVPMQLIGFNGPDFHPQGIALYTHKDELVLFAVNRRRDFDAVEIFKVDLEQQALVHIASHIHPLFRILGDIVPVGPSSYYVTNRQFFTPGMVMYVVEVAARRPWSYVAFCDASQGEVSCHKVTNGTNMANGIAISKDGKTLYVSTPASHELLVYDRNEGSNNLTLRKSVYTDSSCGNLEVDQESGDVYAACHPKLLSFWKHTIDTTKLSPSQVLRLYTNKTADLWEDSLLGSKMPKLQLEEVFLSQGQEISGASVAAFSKGKLLIGSSYSKGFLMCGR